VWEVDETGLVSFFMAGLCVSADEHAGSATRGLVSWSLMRFVRYGADWYDGSGKGG